MIIMWHRKDLRLEDNPALWHAILAKEPVLPLFIYDEKIEKLGSSSKWWLNQSLQELDKEYRKRGNRLWIFKGDTREVLLNVIREIHPQSLYWNNRVEPWFRKVDSQIEKEILLLGVEGKKFDEESFFVSHDDLLNLQGKPFSIFQAFLRRLLKQEIKKPLPKLPTSIMKSKVSMPVPKKQFFFPSLFLPEKSYLSKYWTPGRDGAKKRLSVFIKRRLADYGKNRNFPFLEGTSSLSPHIHFGEISLKEILDKVLEQPSSESRDRYVEELAWREFAYYLLYHHPTMEATNWDKKFNSFPWSQNKRFLKAWKEGRTGYPIVDAGIRQLLQTGWMHNRVRMIVASFLIKDGGIFWKKGADFFWEELVDADLANNVLGWQWSAGSGPNANPFFRVFSPVMQGEKYDPEGKYVKTYLPELKKLPKKWIHQPWNAPLEVLEKANVRLGEDYPRPIVNHEEARLKVLKEFKNL